ncbi:MAG: hypothetical protein WC683_02435 [bacterium]
MSIFGSRKKQLRGCGCQGVGLGAVEVPWWCWSTEGFKACSDESLSWAQNACKADWENGEKVTNSVNNEPYANYADCVARTQQYRFENGCMPKCPSQQPGTATTATTTGGSVVCPPGQWPDASFNSCVKSSGACSDANVIKSVQAQIGTTVDGKWGPNSAAALKASGKTYQQLAPGCSGAVPGGGTGGGSGTYKPPATTKTPIGTQPGVAQASGFLGIPLIAWAGVAAVAGVLLYAKSRKKQAVANRRRRRHHRR